MVLSVGYAVWNSTMSQVSSGDPLTSTKWNAFVDNIADLDSRWSRSGGNLAFTGGNVGIGTTTPGTKLHLYEPTASATQELRMDGAGGTIHRIGWDSGNKYLEYSQTTGSITMANASASDFVIKNTGNVGIGTSSPQAPLQVNGPTTSGIQYVMNVIGGAAVAWTDGAAIKIGPSTTGHYGSRIVSYSNSPSSYGSRLQLQTHDTSATNQSFNTGLLIDESGNVGIGTPSPSQKLDVNGMIGIHSTVTTSLVGNIRMENDLFKIVTPTQKQWDFRDNGTVWFYNGSIWTQKL